MWLYAVYCAAWNYANQSRGWQPVEFNTKFVGPTEFYLLVKKKLFLHFKFKRALKSESGKLFLF